MLSIVIPTYNYDCTALLAQLRKQALASTIPLEIIVCDDASTSIQEQNATASFCAEHGIRFIQNTNNLGRTATRNKLALTAQYDWLLFLDSDVLPISREFITTYNTYLDSSYDAVIGGIQYEKAKPESAYALRWKFGIKREARIPDQRNVHPYLLASGNFLIKKSAFLIANAFLGNNYGLDAFFGYQLKKLQTQVLHIDNPVYHLGLETNEEFLSKSVSALRTIVALENKNLLADNHTRLQQIYQSTPAKKLLKTVLGTFQKPIEKNLLGSRPLLFLFDFYRLYHYLNFKINA